MGSKNTTFWQYFTMFGAQNPPKYKKIAKILAWKINRNFDTISLYMKIEPDKEIREADWSVKLLMRITSWENDSRSDWSSSICFNIIG